MFIFVTVDFVIQSVFFIPLILCGLQGSWIQPQTSGSRWRSWTRHQYVAGQLFKLTFTPRGNLERLVPRENPKGEHANPTQKMLLVSSGIEPMAFLAGRQCYCMNCQWTTPGKHPRFYTMHLSAHECKLPPEAMFPQPVIQHWVPEEKLLL